jgi:hypothetical protein
MNVPTQLAQSSDIVTRLQCIYDKDGCGQCTFCLAKAEIERLRAEVEEAYDACRYALAQSPRWQENCSTVIATWEARFG